MFIRGRSNKNTPTVKKMNRNNFMELIDKEDGSIILMCVKHNNRYDECFCLPSKIEIQTGIYPINEYKGICFYCLNQCLAINEEMCCCCLYWELIDNDRCKFCRERIEIHIRFINDNLRFDDLQFGIKIKRILKKM